MKAKVTQVNKKADGYAVVADIEGRNPRQFNFPETVTAKDIKNAIRDYIQEIKNQEGRLPQLRAALIGEEIEV